MNFKVGDKVRHVDHGMKGEVETVREDGTYDIKDSDGLTRPGNDDSHVLDPFRVVHIKDPCKPSWPCNEGRYCQVCNEGEFSKSDLSAMLADARDGRLPRPTEIIRLIEQLQGNKEIKLKLRPSVPLYAELRDAIQYLKTALKRWDDGRPCDDCIDTPIESKACCHMITGEKCHWQDVKVFIKHVEQLLGLEDE